MHLAVLALSAALAATPGRPGAPSRTKIAVTEVKSVQGVSPGTAAILADIVVSEVARAGHDVVSQADISAMLGFEKQRKMVGCEETSCLAEIGGALGVDFILTGQVGQIGTRFRISLQLVDIRKARVAARSAQFCDQNEDALARTAEATVAQILTGVGAAPGAPLPPPAGAQVPPRAAADLSPAPPGPARAGASAAGISTAGPTGRHMTTGAWIAGGGGAALVVAGSVALLSARKKFDDLKALEGTRGYLAEYESRKAGIRSTALAGNVLIGLGAASAGVGGWLWWRSGATAVTLAPTAGDGAVGLLAAGRF